MLGALALLLTVSGLFSVLSYLVQQRTKELSVRMALGATSRSTAALGAVLLAAPAAEQIASTVRLFDPIAYAASLVCVVSVCADAALTPALRAGRIDPHAALGKIDDASYRVTRIAVITFFSVAPDEALSSTT